MATVYPRDLEDCIIEYGTNNNDLNNSKESISSYVSETSSEHHDNQPKFSKDVPYMLSIVRRFDFDSKLARMSVVVKNKKDGNYKIYTKGAPENIRRLCVPDSIPSTFHDILKMYTEKGLRVLALAYNELDDYDYIQIAKAKREVVESKLKFLGLIMFTNELKNETIPTIKTLHKARIKTVMATGDNPLTSISVAKQCGIINSNLPVYLGELVTLKNGEKRLT
jgi:cation-transporting ATPase 13A2